MSTKANEHHECTLSDTDLFTPAFVQKDIEYGKFEEIYPITKLDDNGPIEFLIENATDHFLDLANSYLKIKFKIVDKDGDNLAADINASVVNYMIASLFQQVDVLLNSHMISSSTNTYSYRAILETLLSYDGSAKKSQLAMGLYVKDTPGQMDIVDAKGANNGLKMRYQFCKESKMVEISGKLHCDIFNQGRLLLNGLPLKIILHRQKDPFIFMTDNDNKDSKLRISEAQLCIRKVKLTTTKYQEVHQQLLKNPIYYPINRIEIKTHSIANGISSLNWENAVVGQLPNRVVIAMVDNDAYTGNVAKNPFNFKHFNVSQVTVYLNGETSSLPLKLNFTDDLYLDGYRSLFSSTGRLNTDTGLDIKRTDYKSGYCLFGFDTSPALCQGEHQEVSKHGTLRVNIEFREPLPNAINVILYMQFDNSISVNHLKNIIKDL